MAIFKIADQIGDLAIQIGILGLVGACSVEGFLRDQRSWFRGQLPCGSDGRLDERSGRVDPYAPTPQQAAQPRNRGMLKNASVLIAGGIVLAQLLLNLLPYTGKLIFLLFMITIIVMGLGGRAGRVASVCVATWRWERQHGKPIHVAR